jgi:hypothetical protein
MLALDIDGSTRRCRLWAFTWSPRPSSAS